MRQRVDLPAGKAKELKGRRMIAAAMVKGQMGRPKRPRSGASHVGGALVDPFGTELTRFLHCRTDEGHEDGGQDRDDQSGALGPRNAGCLQPQAQKPPHRQQPQRRVDDQAPPLGRHALE